MVPQTGAKGAKVLVYEYVPNGSLLEYIMGKLQFASYHICLLAFLTMQRFCSYSG